MKNINTLLDACLETTFEFLKTFAYRLVFGGLVMAAAVANRV